MTAASAKPDLGGFDEHSIWLRPARGSRGPAPTQSRNSIVEAAVALADAAGIAAVSMRAVAAALGISAGALYRYLSSRDDLLALMSDSVVGEMRPYPTANQDWLDSMLQLARRQLELYRRHPWLLDLLGQSTHAGPESLAWFDNCLRLLEPVRCAVAAKFEAIAMMTGVVSLVARSEAAPQSFTFSGVDLASYPHLASAFSQPSGSGPQRDLFETTVRILLTALLEPAGWNGAASTTSIGPG